MANTLISRKDCLFLILILSLIAVPACSSNKSQDQVSHNSKLQISFNLVDDKGEFDLNPQQILIILTNQNDDSEQREKRKDYTDEDVAFKFSDLKKDSTYKIEVSIIDDQGYEIYQGSDTAVINSNSQTKTINLMQTKAKGLVVDFKNIPANATAGEIRLTSAAEELVTAINLKQKKAQLNDIIAGNYVLSVELFDDSGASIYDEQTNSNLSLLPARVTNITVDLGADDNLVVDIDWSSIIAPQPPSGLAATATESGIELTWYDSAAEYMVYRGTSEEKKLPLERSENNLYRDRTAIAGNDYYYWVRAIGENGLNSDLSTALTATAIPHQYEGVKVHFKDLGGTPRVYAWYHDNGQLLKPQGDWPGAEMKYQGNNWYYTEFPDLNNINLIFIPSTGENDQTHTLTRTKNEWWYKDGRWYSAYPEQNQKPEVSFDLSGGTYDGAQNLTISLIGRGLKNTTAEFNGQSIDLENTSNRIDKTTIQLGDYLADGETAEIKVTAVNERGTTTATAIYTRDDSYEGDFVFHCQYQGSDTPNIYAWLDSGEEPLGPWPGVAMTAEGDGYYVYKFDNAEFKGLNLIFNWSGGQSEDLVADAKGEYWYQDKDGDGSKELYKKR